jgi:hypothetical protein
MADCLAVYRQQKEAMRLGVCFVARWVGGRERRPQFSVILGAWCLVIRDAWRRADQRRCRRRQDQGMEQR